MLAERGLSGNGYQIAHSRGMVWSEGDAVTWGTWPSRSVGWLGSVPEGERGSVTRKEKSSSQMRCSPLERLAATWIHSAISSDLPQLAHSQCDQSYDRCMELPAPNPISQLGNTSINAMSAERSLVAAMAGWRSTASS